MSLRGSCSSSPRLPAPPRYQLSPLSCESITDCRDGVLIFGGNAKMQQEQQQLTVLGRSFGALWMAKEENGYGIICSSGTPFLEGKEGPINHGDRVKREFSHFDRGGLELRDAFSGYRMYWMSGGFVMTHIHKILPYLQVSRLQLSLNFTQTVAIADINFRSIFMTVVFPLFSVAQFVLYSYSPMLRPRGFHNIWGAASNIDRSSSLRPASEIRTERLIHILSTLSPSCI